MTMRTNEPIRYYVDHGYTYKEFSNYRDAELYCGVMCIPCENIYEVTDNE